jgi:hypothetical protein
MMELVLEAKSQGLHDRRNHLIRLFYVLCSEITNLIRNTSINEIANWLRSDFSGQVQNAIRDTPIATYPLSGLDCNRGRVQVICYATIFKFHNEPPFEESMNVKKKQVIRAFGSKALFTLKL